MSDKSIVGSSKTKVLLDALKYLQRHYVGLLEHGRDRIIQLGGACDPVDVMERGDPHLRQVREVIASVEATPDETFEHPYRKELDAIQDLDDDWDTYGAKANDPLTLKAASKLLRVLPDRWWIVPTNTGGIQLERHADGLDIEMQIERAPENGGESHG